MRYFGSKSTTVHEVFDYLSDIIPSGSFCDPFGGIGVVGSFFKKRGFTVWSGDILTFAHYFQIARIQLNDQLTFETICQANKINNSSEVIDILNNVPPVNGWFVKQYSVKRGFFTEENAKRIEACMSVIRQWIANGWLNHAEKAVLLASLINSMDKVANTAGTYYAYLKNWYRKALKPFRFELISFTPGAHCCRSFLCDAKYLVSKKNYDIIYLDPPYNERCYDQYYHLPETIANGYNPTIHGKSGIPVDRRVISDFNRPKKAKAALKELLKRARFKVLAFQYSENGLIDYKDIRNILTGYGKIEELNLTSKGYVTRRMPRSSEHRLFVVHNA